jgi:hypothetical protein
MVCRAASGLRFVAVVAGTTVILTDGVRRYVWPGERDTSLQGVRSPGRREK